MPLQNCGRHSRHFPQRSQPLANRYVYHDARTRTLYQKLKNVSGPNLMRPYTPLFRLAAIAFVCAALYHLVAAIHPAIEKVVYGAGWLPGYPRWRHLMWVGIFPTTAGLLLWRPRWLVWPYLVFVLQQLHGHGGNAVRLWEQFGQISWTDVGVLTGEFLLLGLLLVDGWKRRGQAE